MSCRRCSMVGEVAPLMHFQIVFQRKITVQMEIQKEPTTPVYHTTRKRAIDRIDTNGAPRKQCATTRY